MGVRLVNGSYLQYFSSHLEIVKDVTKEICKQDNIVCGCGPYYLVLNKIST